MRQSRAGARRPPPFSSSQLTAVALAYKPWHAIVQIDGPTELGPEQQLTLTHGRATASFIASSRQSGTATLEVRSVQLAALFTAEQVLLSTRSADLKQFDVAGTVTNLIVLPAANNSLAVENLSFRGSLTPDLKLQIETGEARLGKLKVNATGQLSLDDAHRLSGELRLSTNDSPALAAALSPALGLTDQQAQALSALLAMAGNQAALTAADGQLFLGALKLGELLPLY